MKYGAIIKEIGRGAKGARDLGRAGAVAGTGVEQRLHRLAAAAPHVHAVAGLDEIERHGPSHEAESDESDVH